MTDLIALLGRSTAMSNWQEKPQVGETVWCDIHKNGIITRIDWQNRIVTADHYAYGYYTYDLDEFFGCFDERLNQWIITPI